MVQFIRRFGALCVGLFAVVLATSATAQTTLQTPETPLGLSFPGLFFDVSATSNLTMSSFVSVADSGSFELYGRPGTYVGNTNSNSGWTLLGTGTTDGTGHVTVAISVPLAAGNNYAFYLTSPGGSRVQYNQGVTAGAVFVSDANLSIREGASQNPGSFSGTVNAPRKFAGSIRYTAAPAAVPTLSEWAMILFGVMLAGSAALYTQSRRQFG